MSSEMSGIRFDLFEKVQVPPFFPAIAELNELELVPEIECSEERSTVVMRGYFRFVADYRVPADWQGSSTHQLEHFIPVDITLPRQRIARVEDVQVVIETYDVEVVSERELNLLVVVELRGIAREQAVGAQGLVEQGEMEREREREREREQERERERERQYGQMGREGQRNREIEGMRGFTSSRTHPNNEMLDEDVELTQTATEETWAEMDEWQQPTDEVSADHDQVEVEVDERESMHVQTNQDEIVRNETQASPVIPTAKDDATRPGMEWTKTFLRDTQSTASFRRMRMCIVQKDDSLDSIAARYGIHAQELMMVNRLGERRVEVGQVLYIPLSS